MQRWREGLLVMALAGFALTGCQQAVPTVERTDPASSTVSHRDGTTSVAVSKALVTSRGSGSSGAVVSTRSSGRTAAQASRCPDRLKAQARSGDPLPPVNGIADRLVPATAVRSALLCSYQGTNMAPVAGQRLSNSRTLTDGMAEMVQDLRWLPQQIKGQSHPCTAVGGPQTNYLLAVNLTDGTTAWVAGAEDPNGCVQATNGRFTASVNLGQEFTATMKTGRWPGLETTSDGPCAGTGRFGQESRLVPDGVVAVDICRSTSDGLGRIARLTTGFRPLVNALNAKRTTISTNSCQEQTTIPGATPTLGPPVFYYLLFRYANGPSVLVRYTDQCTPAIDNSSLQATDDGRVIAHIQSLVPAAKPVPSTATSSAPPPIPASPTG